MLISVLITTWGCEKYLDACRKSVAAAKAGCGAEVEVLELNDGSGVWNARNELIRRAKGDWVCFVDGDDLVSAEWFSELEQAVARNPEADLVTFRLVKFVDGTEPGRNARRYRPFPAYWTACAYRRRVLPESGFSRYLLHEDDLFLMRCLRRAKQVVDRDVPVYYYRRHCDSSSWHKPDLVRFRGKLDFVWDWYSELASSSAETIALLHDLGAAKRTVFQDSMDGAALDIVVIDSHPWDEWFAALDRLASLSRLLPWDYRLSVGFCRRIRWRWLTYLLFALRARIRSRLNRSLT